jgi:hypothetical protein
MRFEPKSQEDIARERCMPEGVYDFEVVDAQEKTSKSGNPMIEVSLKVFGPNGERSQKDWLMAFKLRHFARAVGLAESYEAGRLEADMMIGKAGRLRMVQKPYNGDIQNSVKDYICDEAPEKEGEAPVVGEQPAPAQRAPTPSAPLEDEPPF